MERYDLTSFKKGLEELNIDLNDRQMQQFLDYYELLVEWNSFMNLTAITEFEDVILKHFLDSLAIVKTVDMSQCEKLMDVGTGAGFPGIPLKIAFPNIKVTLLDSLNKRINFLNEVIHKLELNEIDAIHGRAEDYAKKLKYRENYDICVSRAVANLASLSEYCIPYVKISGKFISYKSGNVDNELQQAQKAIHTLGAKILDTVYFQLGGSDMERSFIVIEKINKTAGKYPRKAGLPSKEPIL